MRFMDPAAWSALKPVADKLVFSDVYRSMEAQRLAYKTKAGTQKPGYSAHQFGLAIDIDWRRCLIDKLGGVKSKLELDSLLLTYNFQCYRGDGKDAREAWHYTFSADDPGSKAVERVIYSRRWHQFKPDHHAVQRILASMRMYHGEIDGLIGPLSREAISIFQQAWGIKPSGQLDDVTLRVLAVAGAEIEIVKETPLVA